MGKRRWLIMNAAVLLLFASAIDSGGKLDSLWYVSASIVATAYVVLLIDVMYKTRPRHRR